MSNKIKQNTATTQNAPVTGDKKSKSATSIIRHPLAEMEQAFDRFLGRDWPSLWRSHDFPIMDTLFDFNEQRLPKLDVVDHDNEITVRAEVPGVEKKDLNISLTDNLLTIKGQSHSEKDDKGGDYHKREISSSTFARSFTLPGSVDASKTTATLKDGVLEITLPKTESSKRRNIAVQ